MGKAWEDYGKRCAENMSQRDAEIADVPVGAKNYLEHCHLSQARWCVRHHASWAQMARESDEERAVMWSAIQDSARMAGLTIIEASETSNQS